MKKLRLRSEVTSSRSHSQKYPGWIKNPSLLTPKLVLLLFYPTPSIVTGKPDLIHSLVRWQMSRCGV